MHAVVNGEIYDHDRIRESLARDGASGGGYDFRGHSDSEVAVALYAAHGAPAFLDHLRGEFAIVLRDEGEGGKVVVARDRFGVKPLFWTVVGGGEDRRLLVAAEAKAFLALGWEPEWDVAAIVDGGWAVDDRTVFKGVRKVMPGCWMEISAEGEISHHRYWDIDYKDKVRFLRSDAVPQGPNFESRSRLLASESLRRGLWRT